MQITPKQVVAASDHERINVERVHYESGGGKFTRDLRIGNSGFVLDYPGFWEVETAI